MASNEPPLIRSSKAFSVEIPEGSSSAKARRSDVVAGLAESSSPSDPHFEALSPLSEQPHITENESQPGLVTLPKPDQALSETDATWSQASQQDQHLAVANDGLQDHVVAVASDNFKDHAVGVASDALKDNLVSVATEGLEDHLATLPQENLVDSHVSLPDETLEDRFEGEPEPAAPIPLFVSADDDFPDDHMEIEYPPDVDSNVQALSDEAIVDNVIQVKVESGTLADAHIPSTKAVTPESVKAQPAFASQPVVKKSPAVLTQEMIKQQAEELIARQNKMEEFHGRVDAIRQTVQNINAKLDQIAPHEGKPTSH